MKEHITCELGHYRKRVRSHIRTLTPILLIVSVSLLLLASCVTAPGPILYDGTPEPAMPGTILINEVASTGALEFIELYNASQIPAVFGKGWVVSDDGSRYDEGERVFVIPEGTRIAGKGYLLIIPFVLDNANEVLNDPDIPQDALLDISFSLQADDSVQLYYQNRLVDELDWESHVNALGYREQGGARTLELLVPTPGAPNVVEKVSNVTRGVRLNEINSVGFDFIEIVNTSDKPVTLESSKWSLTDIQRSRVYVIPALTIPAAGYLTIYPSTHEPPYRSAEGLVLAAQEDEELNLGSADTLFLRYDGAIVDSYTWSEHVSTVGRLPDGKGDWVVGLIPTPGADNQEDGVSEGELE